jgi:hypothetical protein
MHAMCLVSAERETQEEAKQAKISCDLFILPKDIKQINVAVAPLLTLER